MKLDSNDILNKKTLKEVNDSFELFIDAINFYADKRNYFPTIEDDNGYSCTPVQNDFGQKARDAIEQYNNLSS